MRRLIPPPKQAFFPKGSFESQAWILAGDAYLEAQPTFDISDVVNPHQEGEDLKMAQEVEEEVYRVGRSCKCFAFSLVGLDKDFPLPRILENKWEKGLLAAVECYSNALPWKDQSILDFVDSESEATEDEDSGDEDSEDEDSEDEDSEDEDSEDEDSEDEDSVLTKLAFRKMGFACHECGRRLAELGWHAKDETDKFFKTAINAFYKGKDVPNLELALCSRIEYHRKLAEFLETQEGPKGCIKAMEEAWVQYQEALDLCSEAKRRLKEWGDGLHTEEAHTYLKLGMFLLRVGKQKEPLNRNGQITAKQAIHEAMNLYNKVDDSKQEVTYSQYQLDCKLRERLLFESVKSDVTVATEEAQMYLKLGIMLMREDKLYYDNQEAPNRKGQISAEKAILQAIKLYKKLDCKQEVAYAQYLLGCVLRDKLLFESVKSDVTQLEEELTEIWLEASKYYHAVGDTDMFLRICMEHSDLYLAMRHKTQMNKGLDQALLQLLDACRLVEFNGSSTSKEFIGKLLKLLMTMCKAAQHNIASSSSRSWADDYELLAGMYKRALELMGGKDFRPLYNMRKLYQIVIA